MIGETLAHYRILEKLGSGGMGEVYLAEDLKLKRQIALKALPPGRASDPARIGRFRREAEAVAALNHPNIVTIYSVEEAGGVHFLTMELVRGTTLKRLLSREGLPLRKIFNLAIPIAEALAAAHRRGIAHRDLKPGNIMVSEEGRVKILDFGLARLFEHQEDEEDTEVLTGEGRAVGTLPYMSPEQIEGEPADHRADIFALGVLLHELATGRRPFRGKTSASLMSAILRQRPRPADEIRSNLPRHFGRIVQHCLEKDPERRFQSALDVRNELAGLREELTATRLSESAELVPVPASRPAPDDAERSIAVLPFADLSPEADNEYFSDGITEEIINALAHLEGLRVAARTSSFSFKGKPVHIAEVARKLGVSTVLEGSVRKVGTRLRITAKLIDAEGGYHLWSERYDRELEDVFAVQDEIARAISRQLELTLSLGSSDRVVPRPTHDLEAYDLYLRGRFFIEQRGEGLPKGLECFQRALAHDPGFALAHAGLADNLSLASFYGFARPREVMPKARASAERALEIAPDLAEAHCALAFASFSYDWDWTAAARGFDRALELDPGCVAARYWYAFYLMCVERRFEDAIAQAVRAVELDPLATYPSVMHAVSLFGARRFDEVVEVGRCTAARDPTSFMAQRFLGLGLLYAARPDEAVAPLEAAVAVSARHPATLSDLATANAACHRVERACDLLGELTQLSERQFVQPVLRAQVLAALGRTEEALDLMENAYEERDAYLVVLQVWPTLDMLRSEQRFEDLVGRLRFPALREPSPVGNA